MRKIVDSISLIISLAVIIILLVLNLTAKQALNEIVVEAWKSIIPESITEKIEQGSNWLEKITNNETLKEYIGEDTIENIKKGLKENTSDEESTGGLAEQWNSTKEELSKYVDEYLQKQEQYLNPEQQMLINFVRLITTTKMKTILLIAMGIVILLMMINQKSIYKWIKNAAWSFILSGVGLFGICFYVKKVILSVINSANITLRVIQTPAFYLILAGIVVRFIYAVFEIIIKINKKNSKEDEISEISEVSDES